MKPGEYIACYADSEGCIGIFDSQTKFYISDDCGDPILGWAGGLHLANFGNDTFQAISGIDMGRNTTRRILISGNIQTIGKSRPIPVRCLHNIRLYSQCKRTNGHGKDGLYCKQHAKARSPK